MAHAINITIDQKMRIKQLCKYLNVIIDSDVDFLTCEEANSLINSLEEEKRIKIESEDNKIIDFFKYYKKGRY